MLSRASLKHDLSLLFVVLIWGVNFPVTKAALAVMPTHVFNAVRFTVAVAVLGALYVMRRHKAPGGLFTPLRRYGKQIVALGLLGYVVYQLFFIIGVDLTTAGNAALIMATSPLWTALISQLLGYDVLRRLAGAGLALSLAGAALVVVAGSQQVGLAAGSLAGNLLMLAAAVLWGAYTAFSKPVVRRVDPLTLTFLGLLVALPVLYGISVPQLGAVTWSALDAWVWGAILFSGGLSIGLAFIIWNTAVRAVGPSSTAVYNNLVPFVALLASVVLIGEPILWPQLAGGALIIGGLLVLRRGRRGAASDTPGSAEEPPAAAPEAAPPAPSEPSEQPDEQQDDHDDKQDGAEAVTSHDGSAFGKE